jgi:hypothetical protein
VPTSKPEATNVTLYAIDPGTEQSALVIHTAIGTYVGGIHSNNQMLEILDDNTGGNNPPCKAEGK